MKKTTLLLLLLVALSGLKLDAAPVDSDKARQVALNFLKGHGVAGAQLIDLTAQTPFRQFHTFALEGGGFVLVAADDATEPILGYSATSQFAPREIPAHVLGWLEDYEDWVVFNSCQGLPAHPDWALLLGGNQPPEPYNAVSALMTTNWDQSPYYNNLCPYDNTYNERTVTGCVATATAQIMKYHNHPATGNGSHSYSCDYGTLSANFGQTTYQWSSMPNTLSASSSSAQVNAVATLMYHVGVGVEMDYGPATTGGSGAHNYAYDGASTTPSAQNALIEYFKYAPDMNIVDRERYSTADFCALLRADLDAGHPILYSGRDPSGGHSFVFDGYNTAGQFHVNWGWGGAYNGYYTMGDLHPGTGGTGGNSSYTFNLSNVALTNIHPNTNWGGTTTVSATAGPGGSATGGGSYSFGNVVTLAATANSGYRFAHWAGGGNFTTISFQATGGSYSYQAQFESILQNDTVSYCGNASISAGYGNANGNAQVWGMRIPAGVLSSQNELRAADLYVRSTGTYTVTLYEGTSSPTTQLYTATQTFSSTGWQSFPLDNPVIADPSKSYWVIFSSTAPYAAALCADCGNSQGRLWGTSYSPGSLAYTFMIRVITGLTDTPGCPAIGTLPWREDFNSTPATTFSTAGQLPSNCWEGYSNGSNAAYQPHVVGSGQYWYSPDGTPSLCLTSGSSAYGNVKYVRLPRFEAPLNELQITFWMCTESATSGTLSVGYFTSGAIETSFVPVQVMPNNTGGTVCTVSFEGAPSEARYIGFRWAQESSYWSCCIDNIKVNSNVPIPVHALSNREQWGTVSGGGTFVMGDTVTLTATPAAGYQFLGWQDGATNASRSLTATQEAFFVATFGSSLTQRDTLWMHDTTFVDHYIHDTTILTEYIHDTTIVNNYIHDTTYVTQWQYDTITVELWRHDTTIVTEYVHDTVALQSTLYDLIVRSADATQGIGAGNGRFAEGTQVELAAIPLAGHRFERWSDGDASNPRTVVVSGNATYEAQFTTATEGIDPMGESAVSVSARGGVVTVSGAQGQRVRLMDMLGRTLSTQASAAASQSFRVPATGAYLVQVGEMPAQKVVVVE